ncbi:MAG: histidine phosphatase family protein [Nanoarchaeota archaeon]|nr:histidine phosphatase family protein [Nanoarchaeota archaeon]
MEIIFIRHAEKEELGENPSLTDRGIKQAKYLAKRLTKLKTFDGFYCSDLERARQTAEIVSKKIKIKSKIEKSLNEFKSETIKENKNKWGKDEKKHYDNLISFLKKITKNPNEKRKILIIAHGITNRIILSYFLGLNLRKLIQFRTRETGINSVYWVEKFKNWRLKIWNDNNHIPIKLRYNKFSYLL